MIESVTDISSQEKEQKVGTDLTLTGYRLKPGSWQDHCIVKSGVIPVPLSDQYLVFCILKAGVFVKAHPRLFEYRSYENFDANLFNDDLRNVPWHIVENESNIDDALLTWNKLFSEVADSHAPVKRRRVIGTPLPWMNKKISETMKERDWIH